MSQEPWFTSTYRPDQILGIYPIFGHIRGTKNALENNLRKSQNRFRYFYSQYLIAPKKMKNVYLSTLEAYSSRTVHFVIMI